MLEYLKKLFETKMLLFSNLLLVHWEQYLKNNDWSGDLI